MSEHTITHADNVFAGNARIYNSEAEQASKRGLKVALVAIESFQAIAAADPDAIATSQTPAGGGQQDLTLTDSPVTLPAPLQVTITAVGDETGRTFTIIGTDANGAPQAEEITGPNADVTNGNKHFLTVERVFVDDDTAGAVELGYDNALSRGLRAKADGLVAFYSATEDGDQTITGTFAPGNDSTQDATNIDNRARYVPVAAAAAVTVMYAPDLSKEGVGENYIDASQRAPSAP